MGRTSAGIGIQTNTQKGLKAIATEFLGSEFEHTEHYQDIRTGGIVISKSKNFVQIQSSDLAESFFNSKINDSLNKVNSVFQNPELVVAFEQYDSGGTYSYCVIRNGKINRQFRSLSYKTTLDSGELEEIEKEWNEAEVKEFELEDGEKEIILHNKKIDFKCDKHQLPEVILNHILFEYLKIENPVEPAGEHAFFIKKKPAKTKSVQPNPTRTKPWWKFW